jgi:NAD(P)-dependent dehydrogenase (short-subunit alcohol dehydrogenase family)
MGLLDGRVAVVTGAGRGIGQALATHLAAEGARLVVNDVGGSVDGQGCDRSVASQVVEAIEASGGTAVASDDSVASWEGGRRIVETALDRFGRIDILVNNAGILRDRFIYEMSEEEWDAVIDVHLNGSFYCTRAALPLMQQQEWGRIIFVTSTAGFIGTIGQSNYGAAKMGLLGLCRAVALEGRHSHITSNCIAPFAWTRIPASIPLVSKDIEETIDRLFKPLRPEDISPLAVYLASDLAKDITGQLFGVRGKEIYLFSQPGVVRSIHNARGWTPEELLDLLTPTFAPHFTPLDNSLTYFSWKALV